MALKYFLLCSRLVVSRFIRVYLCTSDDYTRNLHNHQPVNIFFEESLIFLMYFWHLWCCATTAKLNLLKKLVKNSSKRYQMRIYKFFVPIVSWCGIDSACRKCHIIAMGGWIDTVQYFLIKLGIKSHMHLWEISISALKNDIIKPTIIMNRTDKNWGHF